MVLSIFQTAWSGCNPFFEVYRLKQTGAQWVTTMPIKYEAWRFESGDIIFREGHDTDLKPSRVEIVFKGRNSAGRSLGYLEEGNSFNKMSIIDTTHRYRNRLQLLFHNVFSSRHA
jgi:hypothetical protein